MLRDALEVAWVFLGCIAVPVGGILVMPQASTVVPRTVLLAYGFYFFVGLYYPSYLLYAFVHGFIFTALFICALALLCELCSFVCDFVKTEIHHWSSIWEYMYLFDTYRPRAYRDRLVLFFVRVVRQ